MREHGYGADCVSGNEVKCALDNGFTNTQVVFAGVGKTDDEINLALDNDIFCFNCESIPELEVINELAAAKNKTANIAFTTSGSNIFLAPAIVIRLPRVPKSTPIY